MPNDGLFVYFDRAGKGISLLEWAKLSDDSSYKFVRRELIEDDGPAAWVITIWMGYDPYSVEAVVPERNFETKVFVPVDPGRPGAMKLDDTTLRWTASDAFESKGYRTEAAALEGHTHLADAVRGSFHF
jgi:hypothetical protein